MVANYLLPPKVSDIYIVCIHLKGHLTVNGTKLEKLPLNVLVQNFGDESQFSWLACIGELTLKEYLMLYALMTTSENVCNTIKRVEQIICEVRKRC